MLLEGYRPEQLAYGTGGPPDAAMIGAAFILLDPIFQGLAISLLFGLASSTALTVLTIPAIYATLRDDERGFGTPLAA